MAAFFRLSARARDYFHHLRDDKQLTLDFDMYYFCLIAGLAKGEIDPKGNSTNDQEMVDEFPQPYMQRREYIVSFLLSRELKRLGVNASEKKALNRVVTNLLFTDSKSKLSAEGVKLMNQYAARGFEIIEEQIPLKPRFLETFMLNYVSLIQDIF